MNAVLTIFIHFYKYFAKKNERYPKKIILKSIDRQEGPGDFLNNIRAILEVADLQVMSVITAPAFANFFPDHVALQTGGMSVFEMPVKGGARNRFAIDVLQEPIDGLRRLLGLILFQLDGLSDYFRGHMPGFTGILPFFAG